MFQKTITIILLLFTLQFTGYSQSIILKGNNTAQTYDGIGAVFSYEKLWFDYPEKQRNEILDYLFLPNYGAAFQILKVEIGYDGNNTAMSWPAHRRALNEKPNFNRGFVWWLMEEAKKRNPAIKLSGLHWGYPAYCTTDELKAEFIYQFVEGAKKQHNLFIDYVGGNQNESAITPEVTKILRKMLDNNGFKTVKIITADEGSRVKEFQVLKYLDKDKDYAKAVDLIGVHYKSRPVSGLPQQAYNSGKPLWSSEDGGGSYSRAESGFGWIDQLYKLFVDLKFSAAVRWSAGASAYDNMPWPNNGIIKTKEPWSGYYQIGGNLWSFAHVTQFTKSGWKFLNTESYIDKAKAFGRYMALKDPNTKDYSIVVNTHDKTFPASGIDVVISPDQYLKSGVLHVWRSNFLKESEWFIKQVDLKANNGMYTIHLDKDYVYTISTLPGGKGNAKSPAEKPFALPYADNFDNYKPEAMARYFVDANGGFEIAHASGGRNGNVLRQAVVGGPIQWHYKSRPLAQPVTEMGDMQWKDYKIQADVLLEQPGEACMAGRFDGKSENNGNYHLEGYWLSVNDRGEWKLQCKNAPLNKDDGKDKGTFSQLLSGKIDGMAVNKWVQIALAFKGDQVTAFIGGKKVGQVTDKTFANGNVAFGSISPESNSFFTTSSTYVNMQIDNLRISGL